MTETATRPLYPRANELFFDLHLPEVFNYTWTGGSPSPVERSPEMAFTYQIPRPGKKLSFHQFLISKSSATLARGLRHRPDGEVLLPAVQQLSRRRYARGAGASPSR